MAGYFQARVDPIGDSFSGFTVKGFDSLRFSEGGGFDLEDITKHASKTGVYKSIASRTGID